MASVHRDPRFPTGVWYCQYRLADGKRAFRSTGKRRKSEAQIVCQAWQQAENEASGGSLTRDRLTVILNETLTRLGESPVERISVKQWLEDWLASKTQVSPRTQAAYKQIVREFLAYLGEGQKRRLESITERDIEGFIALLRTDGRSPVTINKLVRKYLSAPFERARGLGKIRYNPVMATQALKTEPLAKATFTAKEVVALLTVADHDWQGAILFAYSTGARLGDVANLPWSALDLQNGVVTFRERKTGAQAVLGLHPDFLDWIAKEPRNGKEFVFPTLAGRPLNSSCGLSNTFTRLVDKAGIEKRLLREGNDGKGRSVRALSFHSFRHTAASNVFNQAALKEITRRVTNHAAGGVVDRYIHEDSQSHQSGSQTDSEVAEMKVPRATKLKSVRKMSKQELLRLAYLTWRKQAQGQSLREGEERLPQTFEHDLLEKLAGPGARAFLRMLLKTFKPPKYQLLDLIILEALEDPKKTKAEIQAAIEKDYPKWWGKRAFQKAWREFSGSP